MAKEDIGGVWRTIRGRRVFIKDGQSLDDAIKASGKFNKNMLTKQEQDVYKETNEAGKIELERRANERANKETKSDTPVKEYKSSFNLEAPVNDFDEAQAYLQGDDMTQYVPDELKDVITKAEWSLDDESSGSVTIQTNRELTDDEKASLQDWIDGQNSDGLGEGFEQQQFAESYFNPDTGDGPYTYSEYEEELQREYDELDPSEYSTYFTDEEIEDGMQNYMEMNGIDHIEDETEYNDAVYDVTHNPEEYMSEYAISRAKDEYFKDYGSREQDWYTMSSIRRSDNGFTEKDIAPTEETTSEPAPTREAESTPEAGQTNRDVFSNDTHGLSQEETNEVFQYAIDNKEKVIEKLKQEWEEEGGKYDQSVKDLADKIQAIENSQSGQDISDALADADTAVGDDLIATIRKTHNERIETLESRYPTETTSSGKEYMRQSHPYDETEYSYAEKNADGSWTVTDPTKQYGTRGYQEHIYDTQEEAREKMAEIDGRIGADTKNAGKNYEGVSYNNYDKQLVSEGTVDHREYKTLKERTPEEQASDERYANAKVMYKMTGDEKYKKEYQDELKATSDRIRNEVEAEKATKQHTNVFNRSDAEIDDAIQSFNDFKRYETFSNDEWNYADQTRRDKLATNAIKDYLSDNHITREEMLDLADVMENENHNTEASLIEKVYDGLNKADKSKKTTNQTMNDAIREKAYKKYMKEHPNSKKTLEDFLKKK